MALFINVSQKLLYRLIISYQNFLKAKILFFTKFLNKMKLIMSFRKKKFLKFRNQKLCFKNYYFQ
jgi:hypothetical protein